VHGNEALESALETSEILFGKGSEEALRKIPVSDFEAIFEGVPQYQVAKSDLASGLSVADLLAVNTSIFPSKGKIKEMVQNGGLSINKQKVTDPGMIISAAQLISDHYILVQKGKKDYYLILAE
jgi:tyrosyl-tRNA synthetase